MTSHSLTGKNTINIHNLKGMSITEKNSVPSKINKLKEKILEDYLLPLFTKNWNTLYENNYFIENIQKNIQYYYNTYKLDELTIYNELLKVIKILIDNYQTLENYENKTKQHFDPNQITSFIFKTTKIRLLPEYEIYDIILGKPNRNNNEKYDVMIISEIEFLLKKSNINFRIIQQFLFNKYPNRIKV